MQKLFFAVFAAIVLSGCTTQIKTASKLPALGALPSPQSVPVSHRGQAYLVLGTTGDKFMAHYRAITTSPTLENNGKFFVLPVRVWEGTKWSTWKKAVFFHWTDGDKLSPKQVAAIKASDLVVACYAATLPAFARGKAWIRSEGKTTVWLVWDHESGVSLLAGKDSGLSAEEREAKQPLGTIKLR